ncbi:transposase [Lederbergia lenta]|uniref:Transposase n=1 Tax=Lederbergia lenta TaxID=1467 RepID=A0A2X4VS56_LEDLE|nr:transposase [Lederbergia lenta]
MTIIRQESLFHLQELYNLEPTQRFEALFSAIDIDPIFAVVTIMRIMLETRKKYCCILT